jgi:uncharacterized membrane protein
LPAHVAGGLTG